MRINHELSYFIDGTDIVRFIKAQRIATMEQSYNEDHENEVGRSDEFENKVGRHGSNEDIS